LTRSYRIRKVKSRFLLTLGSSNLMGWKVWINPRLPNSKVKLKPSLNSDHGSGFIKDIQKDKDKDTKEVPYKTHASRKENILNKILGKPFNIMTSLSFLPNISCLPTSLHVSPIPLPKTLFPPPPPIYLLLLLLLLHHLLLKNQSTSLNNQS
jgi:hypothetical protein